MKCQNCDAPVLPADERCDKCGAKLLHRRVVLGAPKAEEFTLTADEPPADLASPPVNDDWRFDPEPGFESSGSAISHGNEVNLDLRWGGFFRRLGAFILDLIVIILMCALMGLMAYIGYKVGLAAHDRAVSLEKSLPVTNRRLPGANDA